MGNISSPPPSQPCHPNHTQHSIMNMLGDVKLGVQQISKTIIATDRDGENTSEYLVFNAENCSPFERELPEEVFIHILIFLNNREVIKLGRVCKNFSNYWIRNLKVWNQRTFDESEPDMLFKPMMENYIDSILYYYNHFLPTIMAIKSDHLGSVSFIPIQIILIGKEKCGKSELLRLVCNESSSFDTKYNETFSPQQLEKRSYGYESNTIQLKLWDTSGKAKYLSRSIEIAKQAKIVIFCFDLNDRESYNEMKERIEIFEEECCKSSGNWNKSLKEAEKILLIIGLKRDLDRKIPKEEIVEFVSELAQVQDCILMRDLRIQYCELSSKVDSSRKLEYPLLYGLSMILDETISASVLAQSAHFFVPAK